AEAGAPGWRRSAEQALAAIEIGAHFQQGGPVFRYSDVALEHTVMESPVLTRLLQGRLEQIDAKPMLLETLRAWFEHGPHRKAVAAALKIHPNSLAYRIECIEAILEQRLDDLRRLPALYLALRQRQLLLRPGRKADPRH
ncbi:MAG: helix-turn-helix domain-containing protein, partial [Nevskia sp.]|nr:helix-turn-helix domain-containing protein [Nevskia sp.]